MTLVGESKILSYHFQGRLFWIDTYIYYIGYIYAQIFYNWQPIENIMKSM